MMKQHEGGGGRGTLEVSGSGRVEVAPDEAIVQLGVVTEAKTASDAVEANAKVTQAVVDAVSAEPNHGVTTGGLGVSPMTRYEEPTHTTVTVGFRATNGVTVKTKIGHAGRIYDAGIRAGANESGGIEFRVQQEGAHHLEALRLAVEDAAAQARVVALAAGVTLGEAETIAIDAGGGRSYVRSMALAADSVPTPVSPGNLTISAGVRVVYRTSA